jgi:type I restriction enzyme S subunit
MKRSYLSDTEDHISHAGLENGSRLVPVGSIFVVIRGMILMRDVPVAQAAVPMAFNQDMKALVAHNGVSSDFLLYSLQRSREQLLRKVGSSAHGTRTLMTSAIEQLLIGVPSDPEQEAISQTLKAAEAKEVVHQRTGDRLREFFRTLLHQLMTAQVRVHDLDLSALDQPAAEAVGVP